MSSKAKRLEKKTRFAYPLSAYNDTVFTLLLSANMQQKEPYMVKDIMRLAKEIEIDFADENWPLTFAKDFGKPVDWSFICAAVSKETGNMLFSPLFEGHIIPLREDGVLPRTMMNGRYIVFTKEN